jgi:hemolysin III
MIEKYKRLMRVVDHCSVYFLFPSSYAPFSLTVLRNHSGPLIFVWLFTIVGSVGQFFFFDIVDRYTVILYLAMGWITIVAMLG